MSCSRASEIDLAAFAAEPQADDWSAFRAHYPLCADCSRAVASWGRLRGALREAVAAPSVHPADRDLLDFAGDPGRLPAARRTAIETHLAGCAPCRSELSVLRGFDFGALGASAHDTPRGEPRSTLAERLAALIESLFRPALRPAWALALILLLAIPIGIAVWRGGVRSPGSGEEPPIARVEPTPARSPAPAPEGPPPDETSPEQVAHEPKPDTTAPPEPETQIAREEPSANATPDRGRARSTPAPPQLPLPPAPPRAGAAEKPDLIAELLPEEAPVYRPQLALAGGSFDAVRTHSAIRSTGAALPEIRVLGPEHVGATASAAPTLYWYLAAESPVAVELTVIDERGVDPLVELHLEPPLAAGLHALDLAARGVALEPGVTYAWFATLVPDRESHDRDVSSRAAVRRTPASGDLASRLAEDDAGQRAHRLASAGYWYDAFDALSRLADTGPEVARAGAQRAALLEQVGLSEVAARLSAAR